VGVWEHLGSSFERQRELHVAQVCAQEVTKTWLMVESRLSRYLPTSGMARSAQSALKGVAEMNLRLGLAVVKPRELEQESEQRLCMGWWWWLVLVIAVIAVIAVDPHF
jgi:hypothetical protein